MRFGGLVIKIKNLKIFTICIISFICYGFGCDESPRQVGPKPGECWEFFGERDSRVGGIDPTPVEIYYIMRQEYENRHRYILFIILMVFALALGIIIEELIWKPYLTEIDLDDANVHFGGKVITENLIVGITPQSPNALLYIPNDTTGEDDITEGL